MAGKIRHLKLRNGRYSARLVVPKHLRPLVGKAELETQLGPDRGDGPTPEPDFIEMTSADEASIRA